MNSTSDALMTLDEYKQSLLTSIYIGITATNHDDAYSVGLRNGLRICKAYIDGQEPEYEEVQNNPLTWKELKGMEGKPVFVEERYRNGDLKSSGWWLIDFWNDDQICMRDPAGNPWNEHRSNYGRDWQAYRKERK